MEELIKERVGQEWLCSSVSLHGLLRELELEGFDRKVELNES